MLISFTILEREQNSRVAKLESQRSELQPQLTERQHDLQTRWPIITLKSQAAVWNGTLERKEMSFWGSWSVENTGNKAKCVSGWRFTFSSKVEKICQKFKACLHDEGKYRCWFYDLTTSGNLNDHISIDEREPNINWCTVCLPFNDISSFFWSFHTKTLCFPTFWGELDCQVAQSTVTPTN